jgi:amino acid transporter
MPVVLVLGTPILITYALLSSAIPRIGGDYTFVSRIISPNVGFAANLCLFCSTALSAGIWAWWASTQALNPILTVIGSVTGSHTIVTWGAAFSSSHQWVPFITGLVTIAIVVALAIAGMRIAMRVFTVLFAIAFVGFVIDIGALLFTSHASFVHTLTGVAGTGAYAHTTAIGARTVAQGYSVKDTIGALYLAMSAVMYAYWGAYTSAEFKGANHRSRQLSTMLGAGLGQGILVFIALIVLLNTVGHAFIVSAVQGNFTAPGGSTIGTAGYVYFGSLVLTHALVVTIVSLMYLGWFLPGQFINEAMAYRAVLTWSFDGLLPKVFAKVNDRTHTPIPAIMIAAIFAVVGLALSTFTTKFLAILGVVILFNYIPAIFVGLAAVLMPWRRPHLYRGSPADWRIAGLPVTPIVGAASVVIVAGMIVVAFYFHNEIGLTDTPAVLGLTYHQLAWILPLLVGAISVVWYRLAVWRHARRGVDMKLAYTMLPPD